MSTLTDSKGQNVTHAISVIKETYKNLNLLFSDLDSIGEEKGFLSLTPRFMRWKSDSHYDGWLTSNFIKLYQLDSDPVLENFEDLRNGDIYGIEIELADCDYPTISLLRYKFNLKEWTKLPGMSDHWLIWDPFRIENLFTIQENEGVWTSETTEKAKKKYWGLEKATAVDIPLFSITSTEDIEEKIFKKLLLLTL